MADDRNARDKQAQDAERRQREREMEEELERKDEERPPVDERDLDEIEAELEAVAFPATGSDVVDAIGDREVEAADGTYTVEELVPDADEETFDAPDDIRVRIQRPTVATAMKRVVEASHSLRNVPLGDSQREAYEKTFRELESIDADDDDEGIRVVADWIVEQIQAKGALPGSRGVRRRAAKFCRANGYAVRNDEWLGV